MIFICIDWITEDELHGKKWELQNWTDGLAAAAAITIPVAAATKCVVWPKWKRGYKWSMNWIKTWDIL